MKTKNIFVYVILTFFPLTNAHANAHAIQLLYGKNIEIDIDPGTSRTISADHLFIKGKNVNVLLKNRTMDVITWKGNWLHLQDKQDKTQEVRLPFIKQTTHNHTNQYYIDQMDIDYRTREQMQIQFERAHITIDNNLYTLDQFSLSCKKRHNPVASTALGFCLTGTATAKLFSLTFNRSVASYLQRFLSLPTLSIQSTEFFLRQSSLTIKKNAWRLDADVNGAHVSIKGVIHYDANTNQLNIDISRATTTVIFPINIKSKIYKKLYSIRSKFLSVAPNNGTISINLSYF